MRRQSNRYQINRAILFLVVLSLAGCAGRDLPRPYFSRTSGSYIVPASGLKKIKKSAKLKRANPSRLKKIADSYLGAPYRWGGGDRSGMDCSGFIRRVYKEVYNLELPHNSGKMNQLGRPVSVKKLMVGDIVLFGSFLGIHHAGIYIEKDTFIHASVGKGVMYSKLSEPYYRKKYKGARRIVD